MKRIFADKKIKPVPTRVGLVVFFMSMMLGSASIAAGMSLAPEDADVPVVTAEGSVISKPWYITVDGRQVALVESKEAAEKTLENVLKQYQDKEDDNAEILDVEVKQETAVEKMDLHNGDPSPDIMTVKEAEKLITEGNDGKGYLTVVVTEELKQEEDIEFAKAYKGEPDMDVGETVIQTEGEDGVKQVTKKVVKENGEEISEEVLDEQIIEDPKEQIVLTGIKKCGNNGRDDGDGVSYDLSATYTELQLPVQGAYISSEFGSRWGSMHKGVDLAVAQGSSICAADDGVVYFAGYCGSYGNIVKIDHGNGMQTYYAHCSKLLVNAGQQVETGQQIALVGSTGNSTGPHLHFEVIINKVCVDPIDFLEF